MFQILFCSYILLIDFVFGYDRVVTLYAPFGQVSGSVPLGMNYTMFLGIPYGLVNESNPFGNASPHPYLRTPPELIDLTMCPHYAFDERNVRGEIQCLRLNVYKPNIIAPGRKLPVMVYIHGGDEVKGSDGFGPHFPTLLMPNDVIVVAVTYRVGPYGHLCIPNTEYNNQALKDQNLALRWVKNYIGSFGGDPDNILLFGHSSGSIAVHLHLLYDKDLLYNKVILQSGVAVSSFVNDAITSSYMPQFVQDVGLDAENIDLDRFIQTISTIDTNTIINITKHYTFRPCIDGEFIRKTPNMRNLQNIKLMIGATSDEMVYFNPREELYDQYFNLILELKKSFSVSKMADSDDAITAIKHFYMEDMKVNNVNFASDLAFYYPMERTVRYYVQNNCTVYRYLFSYDGERNNLKISRNITTPGATHGDELGYLFSIFLIKWDFWNISKEDQVITDRMTRLWTNFAKYGDPTPETTELLPVKWTPETAGAKRYLQIDSTLHLHSGRPFEERMAFWDSYYARYGMYAKGIILEEDFTKSRAGALELRKLLLFVTLAFASYW